ncbi:hypothetical protein M9H77_26714 [Catharanthus roseus]|uniref:Uncharacterized protein n=1 Tax=Catharanthus roseus TaxID=4058 RepID=A0ACC0ABG0_CATRO|nr:hypothetical protein M9H77_26714 [Catharanthus roseus]
MKLEISLLEDMLDVKFEDSTKDEDGKLAYKSINTINFSPSNSYLSFETYFKEINMLDECSFANPNIVGFELECGLFDVRHDKSIGMYVEQSDYVLLFLGIEDRKGFQSFSICSICKDHSREQIRDENG